MYTYVNACMDFRCMHACMYVYMHIHTQGLAHRGAGFKKSYHE